MTSTTTATQRGLAQLSRDAFEHINIALKLEDIFLPPGSLVLITCAGEGWIDKAFTIQSVSGESKGAGKYNWNYQAGTYNPTLIDHIRNVHKAVKRPTTTGNVPVVSAVNVAIFDTVSLSDEITATNAANGPYKWGDGTKWGFGTWNA